MVKRYDIIGDPNVMEASQDGEWVKEIDYAALLEAAKLLVEAMEEPKAYESAMNNPIARALIEGKEPT